MKQLRDASRVAIIVFFGPMIVIEKDGQFDQATEATRTG